MRVLASARTAAAGIARHRATYPAVRLRPSTERRADVLLVELGFPDERVRELSEDYERSADELFPQLLERARAAGEERFAAKLELRDLPSHESKRLVYLATRVLGARTVVETGTFSGALTTFFLRALAENGGGRLYSLDLPARRPIPRAIDVPLPAGHDPGWLVPDELRGGLELVLGDSRRTLPRVLAEAGPLDLFMHDSLHTTRHMLFEYRAAWKALRPGGLLLSDDVFSTPAFWWFAQSRRVPFLHIGNVGVTRKPAHHDD